MNVEFREQDGINIIKISGQVRISTQNDFKDILDKVVEKHGNQPVIINMEGVVYMNSIGIGVIIDTFKKFKVMNGRLVLCSLLPDILNLFEVTKLNSYLEIYTSESEALSKVVA